jgi:hypothetical protein
VNGLAFITIAPIFSPLALRAQRTAVAFDPLRGVLHQHRVVAALGNRPEAAAGKALPVARTGAEEEVKMAALQRRIFHLCQQPRAEVLAAKLLVDRHAFDDVGGKPCATHQLRPDQASTNSVMSLSRPRPLSASR